MTVEAESSTCAPGPISMEHRKALLKALKVTAAREYKGIIKGSACRLRVAQTPPLEAGNDNDKVDNDDEGDCHEETDNADT
ncbi:hypothetical protein HDU80_000954 [Chytriomyces hyalinus]|nr:hypothetical protein HDU80_000954 [Chytriomyces hyalinus]